MNFVAIDFETAQGKRWSICQVGIVVVENGEITNSYHALVQPPGNEYQAGNIKVHKIQPHMTANKPTFDKIWLEISTFFNGNLIVAHNADFDVDCLKQTLEYYNLPFPDFKFECTYKLTGFKLEDNCKAYSIDYFNKHDALNDAEACANLYLKILNHFEPDRTKFTESKKNKKSDYYHKEKLSGSVLQKNLSEADTSNLFYNKKVVFTGELSNIGRSEAANILKKMGADIGTSISKKTDFIIIGENPGPSKMQKIEKLISEGSNLKIINEDEFLKIVNG